MKATLKKYEDEPLFPCIFIPEDINGNPIPSEWRGADTLFNTCGSYYSVISIDEYPTLTIE